MCVRLFVCEGRWLTEYVRRCLPTFVFCCNGPISWQNSAVRKNVFTDLSIRGYSTYVLTTVSWPVIVWFLVSGSRVLWCFIWTFWNSSTVTKQNCKHSIVIGVWVGGCCLFWYVTVHVPEVVFVGLPPLLRKNGIHSVQYIYGDSARPAVTDTLFVPWSPIYNRYILLLVVSSFTDSPAEKRIERKNIRSTQIISEVVRTTDKLLYSCIYVPRGCVCICVPRGHR